MNDPTGICDPSVLCSITGERRVPGVAACVTDRHGDVYRRAAGERRLGGEPVIEGFDDAGRPKLRRPRSAIATRQLMLHAASFGYDAFDEDHPRLTSDLDQPSVTTRCQTALATPLVFGPGERREYGSSIDWAGQVVESVPGERDPGSPRVAFTLRRRPLRSSPVRQSGHNMRQVPFLRLYARQPAPSAWATALPTQKSATCSPAEASPGRCTATASMTSVMAPTGSPLPVHIKSLFFNCLYNWHAS